MKPKAWQENILNTITPLKNGTDRFFLRCLLQILTLPSEYLSRKWNSSDQPTFFPYSCTCLCTVANKSGTECGLLPLYPICFKVWLHTWFSAYTGCNEGLFELLLPSYKVKAYCPFSPYLWHQQLDFLFFWSFSANPKVGCVGKSQ